MMDAVFDAHDADFESTVVERSKSVPVVVDFWAPWCGPCRTLGPMLERLATESNGAFVLAKVNVDENPTLSQALRVQSIPMVIGVRDGRVVAEFTGALPESSVREFLARLGPSEAEKLARRAAEELAAGQIDSARSQFEKALAIDARCPEALMGLAEIAAGEGEIESALNLLERVPGGPHRPVAERRAAELRVRSSGDVEGDEASLRARLANQPSDLDSRFALARLLAAQGRYEDALQEFLEIVRHDRRYQDDGARKAMVDIFGILGPGNEVTEKYRSELAKILFS